MNNKYCEFADWPAPTNIVAGFTHRRLGDSVAPYERFNLALHVGDNAEQVLHHRQLLDQSLPGQKQWQWLEQVHGNQVIAAHCHQQEVADASYSSNKLQVCAVMTADCLPILLCDQAGKEVAAIHAGWRGLCAGVIENTVSRFNSSKDSLLAYLGPAIGPAAFEVGEEVKLAFQQQPCGAESMAVFKPKGSDKYLADLYQLARIRLQYMGVRQIYGGEFCTYKEEQRFYSYRRDGQTGRQVSFIYRLS